MIRLSLCAFALAFSVADAASQTLTTNAQGQRVIVYPDGTTRLFSDPAADRAPAGERTPAGPTAPPSPTPTLAAQTTPEQEANAVLEVRRRVGRLDEEYSALTRIAKKARSREAKLTKRMRKLRKSRKVSDRAQVEIVNQQLLEARESTRTAEAGRRSVDLRAKALRATFGMSIARRSAHLDGLGLSYLLDDLPVAGAPEPRVVTRNAPADAGSTVPASEASARSSVVDPATSPSGSPAVPRATATQDTAPEVLATTTASRAPAEYAVYDRRLDTRYTPPRPTCSPEFDGVDEFTGKRRVVLAEETFFTYTSPELKPFLKGASLITCKARLLRTGKTVVLEASFVIRSQYAAKEFGVLPRGSQMTFKSVGGEQLSVRNQTLSQADYDPVAKVSTYRGRYPLSRGAQKFLEDALLDEVRVMWGTGFDDYALYDLTFLQRQLDCL